MLFHPFKGTFSPTEPWKTADQVLKAKGRSAAENTHWQRPALNPSHWQAKRLAV